MNLVNKITFDNVKTILLRWDVLICFLMGLFFYSFAEIDLWVSSQFYDGEYFFLNKHPFVYAVYIAFAKAHFLLLLLILIGLCVLKSSRLSQAIIKKKLRFLLLVLVVAPGLLVNFVLKDNSVGRPRPVHIIEFGGQEQFVPAFVYSGACSRNCSFTSGHSALGFIFITLGWMFSSRPLFALAFALGSVVSAVRIVQGGHFLSDVVFSFWVVYFTCRISAYFYRYKFRLLAPSKI